jgi:hypothetical protein
MEKTTGDGYEVYFKPEVTRDFLVTTAMGDGYLERWQLHSRQSWIQYAERHSLGVICIYKELIEADDAMYKNGSWQKLLAPKAVVQRFPQIERICLLDTDIRIGPFAPNIFDDAPGGVYSVVSLLNGLPYPKEEVTRRMAFFRHNIYSRDYPLDSALVGDVFQEFRDLEIAPPKDYFCGGLVLMDASHSQEMADWFFEVEDSERYDSWEQTHLNFWVQARPHAFLPYEYQAIWNYEMAFHYPFLYELGVGILNSEVAQSCVSASLWNNHFLHFAGSWHESLGWQMGHGRNSTIDNFATAFSNFRSQDLKGARVGKILP